MQEAEICGVIGESGFQRLAAAFYARIPDDPLLGPMYPDPQQDPAELQAAEHRLSEFLILRFGGPARYLQERGHPRLRMRHAPFRVTPAARDRWMELMSAALEECQFDDEVTGVLRGFFEQAATFLINSDDG